MGNSFSHREGKGVDVSQGPRQGNNVVNPLAFMIELVLHKSFSWAFQRYMLKFDISL